MIWEVDHLLSLGLNNVVIRTYFSTKLTEFWGWVPAEFLSAAIVKALAATKNRENSKKWVIPMIQIWLLRCILLPKVS